MWCTTTKKKGVSAMASSLSAATSSSQGVHMNAGEGITSYARNSTPQARAGKVPLVEAAVADLWPDAAGGKARSIGVADLGCSSGPNTLFLVSLAVDAVRRRRCGTACCRPEIRVYLNDLPDNDFNTVFKQLPESTTWDDDDDDVFVYAALGSFFGRLFPAGSLHLAISSFSLHWLSQVPPELTTGAVVNRGNICADRTSPPSVIAAYERQFRADLSSFLSSRAAEIVPGGWLLVALKGRSCRDISGSCCAMNDHPTRILHAMVARGLVDAASLDAYNITVYDPSAEEVREAVESEGSFEVVGSIESGHTAACDDPAEFAGAIRAVHEPMLTRHFGGIDMDEFVRTAEEHLMEGAVREGRYAGMFVHVVSLRRRRTTTKGGEVTTTC